MAMGCSPKGEQSEGNGKDKRDSGPKLHLRALGLGGLEITGVGCFIATAAHSSENHREASSIPGRGLVGVGPVDRVAVVNHGVARFQGDSHLGGSIRLAVVGDFL